MNISQVMDIYKQLNKIQEFKCVDIEKETKEILEHINSTLVNSIKSHSGYKNHIILNHPPKKFKVNFLKLHNKVNCKGETELHIALKLKRNRGVIEKLVKEVDINAQDFAGWTPLHEAVESGIQENIKYLLDKGALINVPGEGYGTPLHKAVAMQSTRTIKLLLKYGADQDSIDLRGNKPVECTVNDDVKKIFQNPPECIDRVEQLFCDEKVTPFCYYIDNDYQELLKSIVKVQETYDRKKVTHFIMRRTHKLSLKILIAMLDGCTIVPQEWINQFLIEDPFIPIPDYSFIIHEKLNKGIQKVSMNKLLKLPKLFDNMNFYIHGHRREITIHNVKLSKDSIGCLISSGGGKLLHRAPSPGTCDVDIKFPFHARNTATAAMCSNYIIYDENRPPELRYQMKEIKHKSSKWLIDSIISFTILD